MFPIRLAARGPVSLRHFDLFKISDVLLALAMCAAPISSHAQASSNSAGLPTAVTAAASALTNHSATLNGSVTPNGARTTVSFDYGNSTAYGSTVNATPGRISGDSGITSVSAALSGLSCGTTYHFRVRATNHFG